VPLRFRRLDVEPDTVVAEHELDLVSHRFHRDPHVLGLSMPQRVHHALSTDVVQEQRDRRRERHLVDVRVEAHVRVSSRLGDDAVQRLHESRAPQR